MEVKGCFHEADIDDDMMLPYPWLKENRVAVLPGDNGQCARGGRKGSMLGGRVAGDGHPNHREDPCEDRP